jgi:glucokinase
MNVIGIDIGGTSIKAGLVINHVLTITDNESTKAAKLIVSTRKVVDKLLEKAGLALSDIHAIGITLPGPVYQNNVDYLPNLDFGSDDPYQSFVDAFKGIPIRLLNDANAALVGEVSVIQDDIRDALMVTVGTGLGGGIMSNGMLIEGAVGLGGEIGHMPIGSPYQLQCGCGRVDCSETLTSATGIRHIASLLKPTGPTKVSASSNVKQIFGYAKKGDEFALRIVKEWAFYMAKTIHIINVITNPSVVIIGGGVANAGDFLLEQVQTAYLAQNKSKAGRLLKFKLASLGNNAGLVGAAIEAAKE